MKKIFIIFIGRVRYCDIVCLIDMRYLYKYMKKSNSKYFREKLKSFRDKGD